MNFHEHISSEISPPKAVDARQTGLSDSGVFHNREGMKELNTRLSKGDVKYSNPDKLGDRFVTPKAERRLPAAERFEGLRGESLAKPDLRLENGPEVSKMLADKGLEGIAYRNGYPDFEPVSAATVKIDTMSSRRSENAEKAYKALAEQWNKDGRDGRSDWKASDVKTWKAENKLAFHECEDMRTCMFVPEKIHSHFSHSGGVQEVETREAMLARGGGKYGRFDA